MLSGTLTIVEGAAPVLTVDGVTLTLASPPTQANIVAVIEQGPQGPAGLNGSGSSGGGTVLTFPITAASSFTANHAFSYRPRAWLVDPSGNEVETDVVYAASTVTLIFPAPFTGTLYLG